MQQLTNYILNNVHRSSKRQHQMMSSLPNLVLVLTKRWQDDLMNAVAEELHITELFVIRAS